MKKILAILALVTVSSTFAQQVTVDYQKSNPDAPGPDSQQVTLNVKAPINKMFAIDGLVQTQSAEQTFKETSRYEAGLTAQHNVFGPVDGYARVGMGEKVIQATEPFTYHSEEIGTIIHAPFGIDAKLGWRFRSALESGMGDTTHTLRGALSYKVTAKDAIGVRYDAVHGDGAAKNTAVFYSRSF